MPRWGLELYCSEIVLIAVTIESLLHNKRALYKIIASLSAIVIVGETSLASLMICEVATRAEQDVRVKQEKYCDEHGITPYNSSSNYYTAYDPGGIPHRAETIASWELDNIFTLVEGKLYRNVDKDYLICGSRMLWSGADARYGIQDYLIWRCMLTFQMYLIFQLPQFLILIMI